MLTKLKQLGNKLTLVLRRFWYKLTRKPVNYEAVKVSKDKISIGHITHDRGTNKPTISLGRTNNRESVQLGRIGKPAPIQSEQPYGDLSLLTEAELHEYRIRQNMNEQGIL